MISQRLAPRYVDKAQIVALLLSGGLRARADRTLPSIVDTDRNAGVLRLLTIDPVALAPVGTAVPPA